jgi:uncharacterized repeat protein (TIGR03803 family)
LLLLFFSRAFLCPLRPIQSCTPKVLHAIGAGTDGGGLWSPVVFDAHGNLYGSTSGGGTHGYGTVFKLTPMPNGKWSESILHNFPVSSSDGQVSIGGVALDSEGNIYGTTEGGIGQAIHGMVYKLTLGPQWWSETVLHRFGPNDVAGAPLGQLTRDESGNLYGTGGDVAFEVSPGPDGWKETILHVFTGKNGDGNGPAAGMRLDAAGNLYSTTEHGGSSARCDAGCGTAYELQRQADGTWKRIILHSFNAYNDGGFPGFADKLAIDKAGNPYGTASGGLSGNGVIFHLYGAANGQWKENVLFNIPTAADGVEPSSGVIMDGAGNLYGTTIAGGDASCDCGVVFKLAPGSNGTWNYTVLHRFTGDEPDANLTLDAKGNIYGTTATGGVGGAGVVFEITQ